MEPNRIMAFSLIMASSLSRSPLSAASMSPLPFVPRSSNCWSVRLRIPFSLAASLSAASSVMRIAFLTYFQYS